LVAPPWLHKIAVRARWNADQHPNLVTQRAIWEVVANRERYDSIVNLARSTYGRRAETLHAALSERLGDRLEAPLPDGGLFLWARIQDADITAVLATARTLGLNFSAGPGFSPDPTSQAHRSFARFAYSSVPESDLVVAAERFADAVDRAPQTK
jgi:2-aminoadipate transaminase